MIHGGKTQFRIHHMSRVCHILLGLIITQYTPNHIIYIKDISKFVISLREGGGLKEESAKKVEKKK